MNALDPLKTALLDAARADAGRVIAHARSEAARIAGEAEDRASTILEEARQEGRREAGAHADAQRVRTVRQARSITLRAEQETLDEFRAAAWAAVAKLRAEPGYPRLLEALARMARERGGADLEVTEHPDGGLVAEGPGRRVDASLPTLTGQAIDELGAEVERLWQS